MTLINISRKTTPERTSTSEEQCIMETTSNFCDEDGSQPTGFDLVCPPVHGGPVFRFNHYDQRFTEMPTWADVHGCLQIQMFDTHPYDTTATHSFRNALEDSAVAPWNFPTRLQMTHSSLRCMSLLTSE
ncbi:tyrosinase-like isoform X2 [Rhincodon typus]|uniref:tyrosinase-like isoform X2 n=1 Tax=Rhincodon typus TaxID=259920 RepID=UPI002030B8EB|nr:tyrosinase-like isoform X2 [Rhincodon typus]